MNASKNNFFDNARLSYLHVRLNKLNEAAEVASKSGDWWQVYRLYSEITAAHKAMSEISGIADPAQASELASTEMRSVLNRDWFKSPFVEDKDHEPEAGFASPYITFSVDGGISLASWDTAAPQPAEQADDEAPEIPCTMHRSHTPHHMAFIRSLLADGGVYQPADLDTALTGKTWSPWDLQNNPWFVLGFGPALAEMMKSGEVEAWYDDEDGWHYRLSLQALKANV